MTGRHHRRRNLREGPIKALAQPRTVGKAELVEVGAIPAGESILAPRELELTDGPLIGAPALHHQLVAWKQAPPPGPRLAEAGHDLSS